MWVVTLEPPSPQGQGDHVYRAREPSQALAAAHPDLSTLCGTWLSPIARRAAEDADVLVLCQAVDVDFLPLMARRRARGHTTIVEFNDHFEQAPPTNAAQAFYNNPVNRSLAYQLAQLADGLQVSTQALADTFGHLNPNIAVLRNAVTQAVWQKGVVPPSAAPKTGRLRLGWGGSKGHAKDIEATLPALQAVMASVPELTLCIMTDPCLKPLFAWVPKGRLVWRDTASLTQYQAFVASFDVGFAPLLRTPFNDCRSDVKYVEYTMAGVAGVYAQSPAYRQSVIDGQTGLLADGPAHFAACMTRLCNDAALRVALVDRAQAQVAKERSNAQAADARLRFWARVAPSKPKARSGPKTGSYTTKLPAAAQVSLRAWVLPLVGAEAELHDGLLRAAHVDGAAHLRRAAQQAPANYVCWLYWAQRAPCPAAARAALKRAQALCQNAPSIDWAMALHHMAQQDFQSAVQTLCVARLPDKDPYGFAPLDELLGQAYLALGNTALAQQAFACALARNRWYRSPAARLAQLHLQQGHTQAAEALLKESQGLGLGHWLDDYLLGEAAQHQGAWPQAKSHFEQARRNGAPPADVHAKLAQSCAALGDAAGARRALARLKALSTMAQAAV